MPYLDRVKKLQYQREHYQRFKTQYDRRDAAKRVRRQNQLNELKNFPCTDCGNRYPPYVMDFDHREGETKVDRVSKLIRRYSWQVVLDEIEKCDLVCSNCHRVRTHARL